MQLRTIMPYFGETIIPAKGNPSFKNVIVPETGKKVFEDGCGSDLTVTPQDRTFFREIFNKLAGR